MIRGSIHSIQTLGTLDGPGVRFVIFTQGCPLRCGCCHNPDTQSTEGGTLYSTKELIEQALRYKTYFGEEGGITLSGGEPLLQAEFAEELFASAHACGLNTCLDTAGIRTDRAILSLLDHTDRVLLDIKYATEEQYREHVGCTLQSPLDFLKLLNERKIPTTLRRVIIPTLNDTVEDTRALRALAEHHPCVDNIELLPFRKMCQSKYDALGRPFPFGHLPEPTREQMHDLEALL